MSKKIKNRIVGDGFPTQFEEFELFLNEYKGKLTTLKKLHSTWLNNQNIHNSENSLRKLSALTTYIDNSISGELHKNRCLDGFVMKKRDQYTEKCIKDINYIHSKCNRIHENARRRGIYCDLRLPDVSRLLGYRNCYYTGVRIYIDQEKMDDTLTFDRVDHKKGYTVDNIVSCSHWANSAKNFLLEHPKAFAKNKLYLLKALVDNM